jgi:hypothetical protein
MLVIGIESESRYSKRRDINCIKSGMWFTAAKDWNRNGGNRITKITQTRVDLGSPTRAGAIRGGYWVAYLKHLSVP